jgi:bifunctional DNase/RNase
VIPMTIASVEVEAPAELGVDAGVVILREEAEAGRYLQLVIGQPEARAIALGRAGVISARPSTWDLFAQSLSTLGAKLENVVITAVEDERYFYAVIELRLADEVYAVSARPSDALALAARVPDAKIVVNPQVLDAVGIAPG